MTAPVIPPHPSSPNGGWVSAFPLRTFLELGAYRTAAGSARGHLRSILGEWGMPGLAECVVLVLSELVSNSVAATAAVSWEAGLPPVRLWALGGPGAGAHGQVMLLVWDAVAEFPRPRDAGGLAESGRGLHMAATYSTRLDFYRPRWAHGGKVARALIDRPAPAEDHLVTFRLGGEE